MLTEHYAGDDRKAGALMAGILAAFDGMDVDEFEDAGASFLRTPPTRRSAAATSGAPTAPWWSCWTTSTANGFTT